MLFRSERFAAQRSGSPPSAAIYAFPSICADDAALPKASAAAPDSVAVGVFRRGARRWGSPRRKIPEAAVHVSAILEPEGDSERRPHFRKKN